ncbi:MAG: ABC transporter ATP-binding protein [Burkholderiales bacterium]|nr:ABC transporter ATP-binding protein [Burkholderiales bacterium]MDE2453052.1 ABC transporter ATP-binding protein [Burkholderiales bacterium]
MSRSANDSAGPLVAVRDLAVSFRSGGGEVLALDEVGLEIGAGERVGLVGESGSGKSTLALAVAGFVKGNGRRSAGRAQVAGQDVFEGDAETLRRLRATKFGFVFQNPIGTLDPTRKIERQFFDAEGRAIAPARITALLEGVGLADTQRVLASYPHELSGGMAQRVAIAMAIEHEPAILVADEPTSALDASIRIQILELLLATSLRLHSALLLVSHDLPAIRRYCERVVVMYAGRIVEQGRTEAIFQHPLHPYTAALIAAMPGREGFGGKIDAIPGHPPVVHERAASCTFAPRCPRANDECRGRRPALVELDGSGGRRVACLRVTEEAR